jgi:HAE1 family hydrophobic/amphiphilic exporter-1
VVLTLDEALAIAAEHSRDIQKAHEYGRWVQGKYVEERSAALPELTITAAGARYVDESQKEFFVGIPPEFGDLFAFERDITTGSVSLSQALFTWGQVGAALRAAKIALGTAEDQLRLQRQGVERDVSIAFFDILLARELAAIAAQDVAVKERHLDEARRKLEAGTATDYDVLSASVQTENARPAVIKADNRVRLARQRLAFLLAHPKRSVDARGELAMAPVEVPSFEDALVTALEQRPELLDLRKRRDVAVEVVKIVGANDKPRLDLVADYGWTDIDLAELGSDGKVWSAGVYLKFPVFDGLKTRGQVVQAKSDAATYDIEVAKLEDAIALEVRAALDAVEEARGIVDALAGTVAEAERLLRMAEQGYELGVKTNLDVDDAQLNVVRARGNLVLAQRDYRAALVNLAWVQGTLGEAPLAP